MISLLLFIKFIVTYELSNQNVIWKHVPRTAMTNSNCSNFTAEILKREQEYHRQGWWSGERLQDRYEKIVATRGDDLAVVDNLGQRLTHSELWEASGMLVEKLENHSSSSKNLEKLKFSKKT